MTSKYAIILKALGDNTRIKIFEMLRGGSMCACKIQEKFDLTQPTLSHHLKVLCDSGILIGVKDGKWVNYSINCELLNEMLAYLGKTECNANSEKCCKKNKCD